MKITLATAGVLTAATLVACGGGSSGPSGHSQAWQDGYNAGLATGQDPNFLLDEEVCPLMSQANATGETEQSDWEQGCREGVQKGKTQQRPR
jgi:hypothetical protein